MIKINVAEPYSAERQKKILRAQENEKKSTGEGMTRGKAALLITAGTVAGAAVGTGIDQVRHAIFGQITPEIPSRSIALQNWLDETNQGRTEPLFDTSDSKSLGITIKDSDDSNRVRQELGKLRAIEGLQEKELYIFVDARNINDFSLEEYIELGRTFPNVTISRFGNNRTFSLRSASPEKTVAEIHTWWNNPALFIGAATGMVASTTSVIVQGITQRLEGVAKEKAAEAARKKKAGPPPPPAAPKIKKPLRQQVWEMTKWGKKEAQAEAERQEKEKRLMALEFSPLVNELPDAFLFRLDREKQKIQLVQTAMNDKKLANKPKITRQQRRTVRELSEKIEHLEALLVKAGQLQGRSDMLLGRLGSNDPLGRDFRAQHRDLWLTYAEALETVRADAIQKIETEVAQQQAIFIEQPLDNSYRSIQAATFVSKEKAINTCNSHIEQCLRYFGISVEGMYIQDTDNIPSISAAYMLAYWLVGKLKENPKDTHLKDLILWIHCNSDMLPTISQGDENEIPGIALGSGNEPVNVIWEKLQELLPKFEVERNVYESFPRLKEQLGRQAERLGSDYFMYQNSSYVSRENAHPEVMRALDLYPAGSLPNLILWIETDESEPPVLGNVRDSNKKNAVKRGIMLKIEGKSVTEIHQDIEAGLVLLAEATGEIPVPAPQTEITGPLEPRPHQFLFDPDQPDRTKDIAVSCVSPAGDISARTTYGGPRSKYAGKTYPNEDGMFLIPLDAWGRTVLGVIDGMGGQGKLGSGYLTSKEVNFAMSKALWEGKTLEEAKQIAAQAAQNVPKGDVCLVVLTLKDNNAEMGHIGDCKGIFIRQGNIYHETKDQSHVQEAIDEGHIPLQARYTHPKNNIVNNGIKTDKPLEITSQQTQPGDLIVLLSDGASDCVSPYEIAQLSLQYPEPEDLEKAIFDLAYKRSNGSEPIRVEYAPGQWTDSFHYQGDNITVQVLKIPGTPLIAPPPPPIVAPQVSPPAPVPPPAPTEAPEREPTKEQKRARAARELVSTIHSIHSRKKGELPFREVAQSFGVPLDAQQLGIIGSRGNMTFEAADNIPEEGYFRNEGEEKRIKTTLVDIVIPALINGTYKITPDGFTLTFTPDNTLFITKAMAKAPLISLTINSQEIAPKFGGLAGKVIGAVIKPISLAEIPGGATAPLRVETVVAGEEVPFRELPGGNKVRIVVRDGKHFLQLVYPGGDENVKELTGDIAEIQEKLNGPALRAWQYVIELINE